MITVEPFARFSAGCDGCGARSSVRIAIGGVGVLLCAGCKAELHRVTASEAPATTGRAPSKEWHEEQYGRETWWVLDLAERPADPERPAIDEGAEFYAIVKSHESRATTWAVALLDGGPGGPSSWDEGTADSPEDGRRKAEDAAADLLTAALGKLRGGR